MRWNESHLYAVEISFDLLDAGSVVHHPNYLVLCERARNQALNEAGYPFCDFWSDGYALALFETQSKYLKPAKAFDRLLMVTKTTKASHTTLKVEQTLIQPHQFPKTLGFVEEKDVPEGSAYFWIAMRLACVNLEAFRPDRLPEKLKEALRLPTS